MEHVTVKISVDGKRAHLIPNTGYMLQRGINLQLYSDAVVKNSNREIQQWCAVSIF